MEWNGEWSDNSTSWTPELKAQLNVVKANDGIFFMSEMDFLRYYSMSTICRYIDGHDNTIIRMSTKKNEFKLVKIETDKPMKNIIFSLT